jgi:hypothetical protein
LRFHAPLAGTIEIAVQSPDGRGDNIVCEHSFAVLTCPVDPINEVQWVIQDVSGQLNQLPNEACIYDPMMRSYWLTILFPSF